MLLRVGLTFFSAEAAGQPPAAASDGDQRGRWPLRRGLGVDAAGFCELLLPLLETLSSSDAEPPPPPVEGPEGRS